MGGPRDGFDMQNLHRNKRAMTLNLKEPDGLELFRKLVKTADIVAENYRPDVKFRLGVDYESLSKINPKIILASISGFGQTGPYANRPGFDQIAQGTGGLMMVTGKPGEGPMRAGAAVADMTAGLLASIGLMTALLERDVSGKGQWVQSNLLQAQVALLDFQAARYLMKGEVPGQVGNDHPTGMPTSAYQTKDGWLNIAATGEGMWTRLCTAVGRLDLLTHDSFNSDAKRSKNRDALNVELNKITLERTAHEWVELLNKAGVPSGPINTMDQVFADQQMQHLEAAVTVQHPRLGELRVVNQAVKLSRTPASMARATPELGEHTEEVLLELGYGKAQVEDFRARKMI